MKNVIPNIFALISNSGNLSVGRVLLLACFVLAMWHWAHNQEIVSTQLTVLLTLIGYVFGTKVLDGVMEAKKGPQPDPEAKGD